MSRQTLCLKKDDIQWAKLAQCTPGFLGKRRRPRGRRAQGIRYERRVHHYLISRFGDTYIPSPWITYSLRGDNRVRWAQPDGLLVDLDAGVIVVIEVKYQHCQEAYWQLLTKYIPLLQIVFPTNLWKFATVEVVKWYDCSVHFPASVILRDCVSKVRPGEFGVHIWKP